MDFENEISEIKKLGFFITDKNDCLVIKKGVISVVFWKKKKWFSGKGVEDGRGIKNLVDQLKNNGGHFEDFYTNNPESYSRLIGIFQQHTGIKLTNEQKEIIRAHMKSRFDIILKH